MADTRIQIMAALPHQEEPLDSEKRFKVLRWGRRSGKTRTDFIATTVGHGPGEQFRGFLDGGEILWIPRDYPNSRTIWRKEILARFSNKKGFHVDKQDKIVTCAANGGTLSIMSAENIDSVRGGDWDGVVIDEAAHMKLQEVWLDVIRPGLVDRKGWCIMSSTTKAGSYFNDICEQVMAGERGPSWGHWYRTAADNPKIDPEEFKELIAEYDDEVKLQQEVYAELVVPGGLAFGEWKTDLHVHDWEPPISWNWIASMDWGFSAPGVFFLWALGPDEETYCRWEFYFKGLEPKTVGYQVGKSLLQQSLPIPAFVICDSQMMAKHGVKTISSEFSKGLRQSLGTMEPGLVPAMKGPGSRINGVSLMHTALKPRGERDEDGKLPHWRAPRMRFHSKCSNAIRTIPKLRRAENNPENVDETMEDHCFDACNYLVSTFTPHPDNREDLDEDYDIHPGFEGGKRRRRPKFMDSLEDPEPELPGYHLPPN